MTIPEFLEKLRQTEGPWTIENGSIRCDDNCPITAVGNGRHAAQYLNIGMDRLGLSMDDVETIAAAADYLDRPLSAQLLAATVRRQHEHS